MDNPNFVLWYSLISDQMALGGVRHGDIFVHQPPDLPIHPEAGAQSFSHPPDLGTVTSLEHGADARPSARFRRRKTGSEQMAMQNRDIFAADESQQARAGQHVQPRRKFKRQAFDPRRRKSRLHRRDQRARCRKTWLESEFEPIAVKIDSACSSAPPNVPGQSTDAAPHARSAVGPTLIAEAFACNLRHREVKSRYSEQIQCREIAHCEKYDPVIRAIKTAGKAIKSVRACALETFLSIQRAFLPYGNTGS